MTTGNNQVLENLVNQKNKINIDGRQKLNVMDGYLITLVEDDLGDDIVIYGYDDVKNIKSNRYVIPDKLK